MGRSHVTPIVQHTELDCGPASLKLALEVFGKRKSLTTLNKLCGTTRNGTSTKQMIGAIRKLGLSVMSLENATLRHLTSSLKYSPMKPRAVIVTYLYTTPDEDSDWKESGHWATVSSYSASAGRIVVFDSYTGKKKSYPWNAFKTIWKDYDYVRRGGKLIRKWQHRLMLVIAQDAQSLPAFRLKTAKVFVA
jgi:ABC-type bacteriocin/lantibiotic exporter with double-glycine peptidase domain